MRESIGNRIRKFGLPCMAFCTLVLLTSCVSTRVRTATDMSGASLHVHGSIVLIDPDIELVEVTTGRMPDIARRAGAPWTRGWRAGTRRAPARANAPGPS